MYKGNRNMVPVPEAAVQYLPQTYTGALPGAWQKPCSPAVWAMNTSGESSRSQKTPQNCSIDLAGITVSLSPCKKGQFKVWCSVN